jgi:transcriptional regulator with XRE-family HTH domain
MSGSCIGERIRAARRRLGLTAGGLAERAKLTPNHVYVIERGEMLPKEDTLKRIARVLKQTVEQLSS